MSPSRARGGGSRARSNGWELPRSAKAGVDFTSPHGKSTRFGARKIHEGLAVP
ncbi:MAG: hypothetical protein KAI47_17870 [Deltaproteobacteria bacterium]|nr:hypothetical protein [Deltaproteobacteria bacterium]